ncbi:MAG: AMP-binding protein, partial [Myxococcota bacterium]
MVHISQLADYRVERIEDDELRDVDLSSWRIALNGSESVTPTTLQRFIDRFSKHGLRSEALTPVYGLAEATLAVTFSDVRGPFRWACFDRDKLTIEGRAEASDEGLALVSLGRPLPGFDVQIVDTNGADLPAGRCGRVLVRGPSIMQGYHGMPLQTQDTVRDGWLDTGDRGFVYDGELYLYGRDKDVIILRGRNYAPQEFEHLLDDVEGVRAGCAAAIGVVPPGAQTEQLVVLVERSRQLTAEDRTDEAIAERVRRQLLVRLGIAPDHVRVLEPGTLPRTSSGKMRRSEASRRYLAGSLTPPRPVTALRMVGELVRSGIGMARARRAASNDS